MTASACDESERPAAEVQHSERANACTRAMRPNAARQSRTIPYKSTHFYETFSTDFRAIAPHTAHCPTLRGRQRVATSARDVFAGGVRARRAARR
ncbi:hypothetical protein [Burkholderia multivorans]|uniref:hypothetical protein n=1 Tax=Burkholderia multivorans TaxID=87883 RepID=UPI0011B25FC7|nr:hypothetical protein [Burkholderia multivorans]MBR7923301.1 hypothetical protein [Burkholderia multivorans]MBR8240169.1 hypothetical protein [Burkholderia multivorans]MBU9428300.1 hypothetical protein [Burkholderia multivorans]MBU9589262.1 hypothetical protein [Burkholderia multivorans]HDR9476126.1 hypothetical protein [Burkholderia multivorans]